DRTNSEMFAPHWTLPRATSECVVHVRSAEKRDTDVDPQLHPEQICLRRRRQGLFRVDQLSKRDRTLLVKRDPAGDRQEAEKGKNGVRVSYTVRRQSDSAIRSPCCDRML